MCCFLACWTKVARCWLGRTDLNIYGCPLDQRFLSFAGIDAEQLKEQLALGKGDGEILDGSSPIRRPSRRIGRLPSGRLTLSDAHLETLSRRNTSTRSWRSLARRVRTFKPGRTFWIWMTTSATAARRRRDAPSRQAWPPPVRFGGTCVVSRGLAGSREGRTVRRRPARFSHGRRGQLLFAVDEDFAGTRPTSRV